jgi:hypothetical protein
MSPAKAEKPPIHETMGRARRFFLERAAAETTDEGRELYEELHRIVEAVEETASLVAHLKIQLDEVRHAMGLHLEGGGPVPHTRRRPRGENTARVRAAGS